MSTIYEQYKKDNKILTIYLDNDSTSPREWDNVGKLTIFNGGYDIGDYLNTNVDSQEELEKFVESEDYVAYKLVYFYNHSGSRISPTSFSSKWNNGIGGIAISTTPYSCSWDWGIAGVIGITKECQEKDRLYDEQMNNILESEIEILDKYISGEVYRFVLEANETCMCCGNVSLKKIDSCSGFYDVPSIFDSANLIKEEWEEVID